MSVLSPAPLAPAPEPQPLPRPERLLIVEDDGFSQQLIELYLRRAGFHDLTCAGDGRVAIDLAKAERFDLVLLDLNLPRVSGVEVLRRLKRDGLLIDTPVIVISSMTNMEEIVQCLDLGAEGYLPKPFNVRLLDERVSACLEMRRLKRAAVSQIDQRQTEYRAVKALHALLQTDPAALDPQRLGVSVATFTHPAAHGGGDISLIHRRDGGPLWAALGTIEAVGPAASLAAAYVLLHLRTLIDRAELGPAQVLTELNQSLSRSVDGWACPPVALSLLALTPVTGDYRLASAGAPDPLLVDPRRGLVSLPVDRGRSLARRADALYTESAGQLDADATLVFVSAGLTDASDAQGLSFGDQKLKRGLGDSASAAPDALVAHLRDQFSRFVGATPQTDDGSILALGRRAPTN